MATDSFDLGALNFSQRDAHSIRTSRPGLSSRNSRASSIRSNGTGGQDRHDVVRVPEVGMTFSPFADLCVDGQIPVSKMLRGEVARANRR